MNTKQVIRIAACLYGGNARLPFEGGVALALLEVLIASRRERNHPSGHVQGLRWLDGLSAQLPMIHVDVVTGASAGGIIGAMLAKILTHSSNPEADFHTASELFIKAMDLENMRNLGDPTPKALFDKNHLTLTGMREVLQGNPPRSPDDVLDPRAELWLALNHLTGMVEHFVPDTKQPERSIEDLRFIENRRFDQKDFSHRQDAVVEAVHATSANPLAFSPSFIDDLQSPEGHAGWLNARHAAGDSYVEPFPESPTPPQVSIIDGGTLENRPLGEAVDAVLRRGLGLPPNEELLFILIDPNQQTFTERFTDVLKKTEGTVIEPALRDQTHSLIRTWTLIRHERITDDLHRLSRWVDHARFADYDVPTQNPGPTAIAEAADQLLFGGTYAELSPPDDKSRMALLKQIGMVLAYLPHDDVLRQAIILTGYRMKRLRRMKRLWRKITEDSTHASALSQKANAKLRLTKQLLATERHTLEQHLQSVDPQPTVEQCWRFVREALTGMPLPHHRGDLSVQIQRIGPPSEGLASSRGEGFAGFFQQDFRAHDLIMGIIAGRHAIADMLTGESQIAWRDHFGLTADCSTAAALEWFETIECETCLPWDAWVAAHRRVTERRQSDWHTLNPQQRTARTKAMIRPDMLRTARKAATRIWTMSAAVEPQVDHTVYGLTRGVFATLICQLLPLVLMLERGWAKIRGDAYQPVRITRWIVALGPLLYMAAIGFTSGIILQQSLATSLAWSALSVVLGLLPFVLLYLINGAAAHQIKRRADAERASRQVADRSSETAP